MRTAELESFLIAKGIRYRPLNAEGANSTRDHWLDIFATNVLKQKGAKIFHGFMWRGFSSRIESCFEGEVALREYEMQLQEAYVVFDEDGEYFFECEPSRWPDLTELETDVYVAPKDMKWTMVFTHEQPEIGPFFSQKTTQQPT